MTAGHVRRGGRRRAGRALQAALGLSVAAAMLFVFGVTAPLIGQGGDGDHGTTPAGPVRWGGAGDAMATLGPGRRPLDAEQRPIPPASFEVATEPTAGSGSLAGRSRRASRWVSVLETIDGRRARAWRTADPDALAAVYAPGSPQLGADATMLRGYADRGLRVSGVVMRFFSVEVSRRSLGSVTLEVVDALGPAVAHDGAGRAYPLPHDLPTRHRIVLVRLHGQWRIATVTVGPVRRGP